MLSQDSEKGKIKVGFPQGEAFVEEVGIDLGMENWVEFGLLRRKIECA